MNLYKLHTNPKSLFGGDGDIEVIPIIAMIKDYENSDDEFFEETMMKQISQLGRRVPEIEEAILEMGEMGVYLMGNYADEIIGGRWKEAEPIIQASDYWEDYQLEHGLS